jgi:hypothetical protein
MQFEVGNFGNGIVGVKMEPWYAESQPPSLKNIIASCIGLQELPLTAQRSLVSEIILELRRTGGQCMHFMKSPQLSSRFQGTKGLGLNNANAEYDVRGRTSWYYNHGYSRLPETSMLLLHS